MPLAWPKPIPTTTCDPRRAMLRSAARAGLVRHLELAMAIAVSFLNVRRRRTRLVEDLSNFPPHGRTRSPDELLGRDVAGRSRHGDDQDGNDDGVVGLRMAR